jgi:hypothetical protein
MNIRNDYEKYDDELNYSIETEEKIMNEINNNRKKIKKTNKKNKTKSNNNDFSDFFENNKENNEFLKTKKLNNIAILQHNLYNMNNDINKLKHLTIYGDLYKDYFANNRYNNTSDIIISNNTNNNKKKSKKKSKTRANFNNGAIEFDKCFISEEKKEKNNNILLTYNLVKNKEYINTFKCCDKMNEKVIDGHIVCISCGYINEKPYINYIYSNNKNNINNNNNNQQQIKTAAYPYKRTNHMKECLDQLQARENLNITDEQMKLIRSNISDIQFEKLKNNKNPTSIRKIIKQKLKDVKLQKYYEHWVYIYYKLINKQAPILSKKDEDEILAIFNEIHEKFANIIKLNAEKANTRKNFLNYSYVLHKLFEYQGNELFAAYCPLLKSKEKLKEQDEIWKKICSNISINLNKKNKTDFDIFF